MHSLYSFFNMLINIPIGAHIGILIFLVSSLGMSILYFGTRKGNTIGEHFRKYRFIYIFLTMSVIVPVALSVLIRFPGAFGTLIILLFILSPLYTSRYIRYGAYRGHIIGRDEVFGYRTRDYRYDEEYYQGSSMAEIRADVSNFRLRQERLDALESAGSFVEPFNNPMGGITISNNVCSLRYHNWNGCYFHCFKKNMYGEKIMYFTVKCKKEDKWNEAFFTSLLRSFSYSTDINSLYKVFDDKKNFEIEIISRNTNDTPPEKIPAKEETVREDVTEKTDLNTASEEELSKLPGISIIIAKKIISTREEEGAFSSVNDFIKRMKIKPHFAKRIVNMVETSEVKSAPKNEKRRELDI